MGYKGTLRSFGAYANQMQKHQMQLVREQQKTDAAENAKSYDEFINRIQAYHIDCSPETDWDSIANYNVGDEPQLKDVNKVIAEKRLKGYSPSFFDKLFNRSGKKVRKLQDNIVAAEQKDEKIFLEASNIYKRNYWIKETGAKILAGNIEAYADAISIINPFSNIPLGRGFDVSISEKEFAVNLKANHISIVPSNIVTQTPGGKPLQKPMPVSKMHEIYKNHICSCVLRLTREFFAYLPINNIKVSATREANNPVHGNIEEQVIISFLAKREDMVHIRFAGIIPSEAMTNFPHSIDFSRLKGFQSLGSLE